ncbi:MAG: viroplasmin family protein [Bdellovibrionales bacterium]
MKKFNSILLFCDGACSGNPGPGGWATVLASPDKGVLELGGRVLATTNNRMEMQALLEGLKKIKSSTTPILVFSDSVYVLRGVSAWAHGWKKRGWKTAEGEDVANRDLWELILPEVSRLGSSRFQWNYVRGHTGVPGNERCDVIAVEFSQGQKPDLYEGSWDGYTYDLLELPADLSLPAMKSANSGPKMPMTYLSLVNGVLQRHKTWSECEARVKGRPGAKFKKAKNNEEETAIAISWGVDPSQLV